MKKLMIAAVLAAMPVTLAAHHGWSSYDASRVINHTANLKEVSWGNPHGSAKVMFNDQLWDVVLAPVPRMEARGLTREMVDPSRQITLIGYPRRDGTREMRIERVIAGGRTVELR